MKNPKQSWDDFLFENRNKAYGAYEIRKTEDRTLLKALLSIVFLFGLAMVAFSTANKEIPVTYEDNKPPVIFDLSDLKDDIPKPVPPKVDEKQAAKLTVEKKSGTDVIPVPVEKPDKEVPLAKTEDLGIAEGPETTDNANAGAYNPGGTTNTENTGKPEGTDVVENVKPVPEGPKSARQVNKMAVFPGCENLKTNNELTACMSQKLIEELGDQLSGFEEIAYKSGIDIANAKLSFVVDKNGKIVQIKAMDGGNKELSTESQKALDRISKRLIQKKKYIKPAQMNDGSSVDMIFMIPVKYQTSQK